MSRAGLLVHSSGGSLDLSDVRDFRSVPDSSDTRFWKPRNYSYGSSDPRLRPIVPIGC